MGAVIKMFPRIKQHPKISEIKNIDDLIRLQEIEYRNSAPELYADAFAAELLKAVLFQLGQLARGGEEPSVQEAA